MIGDTASGSSGGFGGEWKTYVSLSSDRDARLMRFDATRQGALVICGIGLRLRALRQFSDPGGKTEEKTFSNS